MKLLAFGSKINLIGIQHGCNYGLYKFNEFEKFERDISDKYFLWLISPNHVRISRFKNSNMANYNKKTGLYWIGRPIISKYFSEQIPSLKDIRDFENLYNIELIYSCIRQFEFKLIPHIHKESTSHYKILDNKCFLRPNQRLEIYLFQNAKILIFDVLNSTLIFFAISSNIPFLILSNNIKQQYKGEFFENFISILKSMKSLYFINEINDFNNELNQLNNDRSYYYKRINLINSIKNDIYKKSFNV